MSARRRLVVSGDDFGAAPEVNAAIVRAHREGILTSASLMVTGDAVDDAVARARAHPRLAVGLHLVLVQGRPALPPREIPRIVTASGTFPEQPVLAGLRYAWLAVALPGGRDELKREIEAQLRAFAATGLRLAHVDESYLLSVIETLPPGLNELYCHPADVQPAALARHQVGYDHAGEVAALVSPRVRQAVEAAGIELVTYPDVVAS